MENEDLKDILIDKPLENRPPVFYNFDIRQSLMYKAEVIQKISELEVTPYEGKATQKYIYDNLMSFGYKFQSVHALLLLHKINSVEEALDLLIKTEAGWMHIFAPEEDEQTTCIICGEINSQHAEYSDRNKRISFRKTFYEKVNSAKTFSNHLQRKSDFEIDNEKGKINPLIQEAKLSEIDISESYSCEICYDFKNNKQIYSLKCGHKFCINCIENYLESNINSGSVLMIKCPQQNCSEEFTEDSISKIISKQLFDKYKKFKLNIEVNMNKKARWCPRPNCGNYAIVKFGTNKCKCKCGFTFCYKCGNEYHGSKSCDRNDDAQYREWARGKKIQKCPNCKILIHKDAGCNHMTCTFCKYQFCWICGMKYSSKHFSDPICGCPFMQFTDSDWGFLIIFFYLFLLLLIWPIYSLILSFCYSGWFVRECSRCHRNQCVCILFLYVLSFVFILSFLVTVGLLSHFFKILYLIYRVLFLS